MSKHLYMCKEYCLCFLVVFDLHVVINIYQYIIISFSFIFFFSFEIQPWPYSEINPHFGVVIKCTLRQLTYDGIHAGRYLCFKYEC